MRYHINKTEVQEKWVDGTVESSGGTRAEDKGNGMEGSKRSQLMSGVRLFSGLQSLHVEKDNLACKQYGVGAISMRRPSSLEPSKSERRKENETVQWKHADRKTSGTQKGVRFYTKDLAVFLSICDVGEVEVFVMPLFFLWKILS